MTDPIEQIKDYYNEVYHGGGSVGNPGMTAYYRRLAAKIAIKPGQRVLDVGCGTGEWLDACSEIGARVHGIDLSAKALEIAARRMPDGVFHEQPADHFPYPENYFDVITCLGSLEHFMDQQASLREIVRVAGPGSRILILVPNRDFLTRRLGLFSGTDQVNAREVVLTIQEWEKLFRESGLAIQSRWKDLHILNWEWIRLRGLLHAPLRLVQCMLLLAWPLQWQYQVYFLCRPS